ncbi:MAG: carbon-nitrogen hydrolase [Verrucomicrobiota bacterium]
MNQVSTVHLGLIQMTCQESTPDNLEKAITKIRDAADRGAQIICLQELFRTLYFCQEEDPKYFDLAETIPGPSTQALSKIAQEKNIVIIASLFEKRTAGLYHNTTVVIEKDGSLLDIYRKMHIPHDPGFYEKFYFTPGDLGFKSIETSLAKVAVLICWDQWYPEAARLASLQGAQILFYPTAIGWSVDESPDNNKCQYDAWKTIQRSHAIANGVFVASVNRTGPEKDIDFWGGSFVCDPFGEILHEAPHHEEALIIASCNLREIDHTRRTWPFLRDRRIDAYEGISQRFLDS